MEQKPQILILETNQDLLWLYGAWLESSGYEIEQSGNQEEALAYLQTHSPQAVLIDVHSNPLEAIHLIRQIRAFGHEQQAVIVTITDLTDPRVQRSLETAGVDFILVKPFSRTELVSHLSRMLGHTDTLSVDDKIRALEQKLWARSGH